MPSQIYFCQCAGCVNGQGAAFEAAPMNWYKERGMSTPKNCPDCRRYIKDISGQISYCQECGGTIRIPKLYMISHHKKIGAWTPPTQCFVCKRGVDKAPRGATRLAMRQKPKTVIQQKVDTFADIAEGIPVEPRIVSADPADYQHLIPIKGKAQFESRGVHISHHDPNSRHSLVNTNGPNTGKSESLFADNGNLPPMLASVRNHMMTVNPKTMREFDEGEEIIRLSLLDNGRIEKTVIKKRAGLNGHELVTTFDNQKLSALITRYGRKQP